LRVDPDHLTTRTGIVFEHDEDELGAYRLAALQVFPDQQAWLVAYDSSPVPGIEVRVDSHAYPVPIIARVLALLGLHHDALSWFIGENLALDDDATESLGESERLLVAQLISSGWLFVRSNEGLHLIGESGEFVYWKSTSQSLESLLSRVRDALPPPARRQAGRRPSIGTIKALFAMSGNRCGYLGCEERLSDPRWPETRGEIAFIEGVTPGAPRYNPNQTVAERFGFSNLILLCPNHHRLIDYLEPERHTAEVLQAMKNAHEFHSQDNFSWAPDEELTRLTLITGGLDQGPRVMAESSVQDVRDQTDDSPSGVYAIRNWHHLSRWAQDNPDHEDAVMEWLTAFRSDPFAPELERIELALSDDEFVEEYRIPGIPIVVVAMIAQSRNVEGTREVVILHPNAIVGAEQWPADHIEQAANE
jgi:hypothetical protein